MLLRMPLLALALLAPSTDANPLYNKKHRAWARARRTQPHFEYPGVREMLGAHCEMEEPRSDKTNLYSLMYGLVLCAKQGCALFGHTSASITPRQRQIQAQDSPRLRPSSARQPSGRPNGPCFACRPLSLAAA